MSCSLLCHVLIPKYKTYLYGLLYSEYVVEHINMRIMMVTNNAKTGKVKEGQFAGARHLVASRRHLSRRRLFLQHRYRLCIQHDQQLQYADEPSTARNKQHERHTHNSLHTQHWTIHSRNLKRIRQQPNRNPNPNSQDRGFFTWRNLH